MTPIIQTLSLPFMIVTCEPGLLLIEAKRGIHNLAGDLDDFESSLRHRAMLSMEKTDGPSRALMPGIISDRNRHLVEELEKQLKKENIKRVAIPWGAAHLPDLEQDLLNRGFQLHSKPRWLRAVASESLTQLTPEDRNKPQFIGLPLIIEHQNYRNYNSTIALLGTVDYKEIGDYHSFSLLYCDLFRHLGSESSSYCSLLPRFFGKPLLFDYTSQGDKSRWRDLLFFSFGDLD